jgi:CheY-like chemotaxis protein
MPKNVANIRHGNKKYAAITEQIRDINRYHKIAIFAASIAERSWKRAMANVRYFPSVAVLVVEDEPLVRMIAMTIVEDAGFEALGAENADHAVRILEKHSNIRIVFTDIDLPGSMNGMNLAATIRGRWPPIEIIITSGRYHIPDSELPPRGVFIPKPYDHSRVIETIQRMAA